MCAIWSDLTADDTISLSFHNLLSSFSQLSTELVLKCIFNAREIRMITVNNNLEAPLTGRKCGRRTAGFLLRSS